MRLARLPALLVVIGLMIAVAVGPTAHASIAKVTAGEAADGTAFLAQPAALQAAVTRLERDHRRESMTSQRWTKSPLMLLAFRAAPAALSGSSIQRVLASQNFSRALTSWWFRSADRAPPFFQLSFV